MRREIESSTDRCAGQGSVHFREKKREPEKWGKKGHEATNINRTKTLLGKKSSFLPGAGGRKVGHSKKNQSTGDGTEKTHPWKKTTRTGG